MNDKAKTKTTKVKLYYDNFSINYESFYQQIQFQKFEEMNYFLKGIKRKPFCLDLGGGTGLLSKWLGTQLITLDLSYKMLKIGLTAEQIEITVACDIHNLPIRKNSSEAIISFTALQNLQIIEVGLEEIFRISEVNAKILITILGKIVDLQQLRIFLKNSSQFQYFQMNTEDVGFHSK